MPEGSGLVKTMMRSRTRMKRKGAKVSPWRTPAVGEKGAVGPSGVLTVAS
jgi:hypothetical protein